MNSGATARFFARIGLTACGCLALFACGKDDPDWRAKAVADAENQIRAKLGDPAAQFANVGVTGDRHTGQTCGFVTAKPAASADGGTGRFIVYIDKTAGPFIEYSVGISTVSQEQFDFAWQHDCLDQGYKS
jgi:hypothetical protein